MSIEDIENKFLEYANYLDNDFPKVVAVTEGNGLAARIAQRIRTTGKDATGSLFSPYSENKIAASNFEGKSRTGKAADAVNKGKALSYKEFRELNNLKTDVKNFEFFGEMLKNLGVVGEPARNANGFSFELGGKTPESQFKIDENTEQEGKIIILASDEENREYFELTAEAIADKARELFGSV